jgi:hypothetical protein
VIAMSETGRTIEGITELGETEATVYDLTAPTSIDPGDTTPRRVYSLDGLMALALAVRNLEEAG